MAQWERIHLPIQETRAQSQDQEDPLEKETATHSSILAWEVSQRSLVGYRPWGCKESDTNEATQRVSFTNIMDLIVLCAHRGY